MSLPQNEHPVDRAIRIVLGLVLGSIALAGAVAASLVYLVLVVAAIALVTGVAGFCPLYALVGFSTRRAPQRWPSRAPRRRPM